MPTFAQFSAELGSRFRARLSTGVEAIFELTHAVATPAPQKAGYESFSLQFRLPGANVLPQGTYSFEHEQLGSFDMFIVPIGRGTGAVLYQAIFNRLLEPDEKSA